MSLEQLYREVILDHYRNPRHSEPLNNADSRSEGVNPMCGDEVAVAIELNDDHITDVSVTGKGCSISQASGSMMAEAIVGLSKGEREELAEKFKGMLSSDVPLPDPPGSTLGDMESLAGVREYPVRIKCALLPWTTLAEATNGRH
ncbi:MAG: SUF system NifU family Fe-S cluster assembly protein [Acidimicrobiia bacterium]|nr:SUF system NifU family Fe-S cluster assembly protein [Acidimicrobiia bacterium]